MRVGCGEVADRKTPARLPPRLPAEGPACEARSGRLPARGCGRLLHLGPDALLPVLGLGPAKNTKYLVTIYQSLSCTDANTIASISGLRDSEPGSLVPLEFIGDNFDTTWEEKGATKVMVKSQDPVR